MYTKFGQNRPSTFRVVGHNVIYYVGLQFYLIVYGWKFESQFIVYF